MQRIGRKSFWVLAPCLAIMLAFTSDARSAVGASYTMKGEIDNLGMVETWNVSGTTNGSTPYSERHQVSTDIVSDTMVRGWSEAGATPTLHNEIDLAFSMDNWYSAKALATSSVKSTDLLTITSMHATGGTVKIYWGLEGRLRYLAETVEEGWIKRKYFNSYVFSGKAGDGDWEVLEGDWISDIDPHQQIDPTTEFYDASDGTRTKLMPNTQHGQIAHYNYQDQPKVLSVPFTTGVGTAVGFDLALTANISVVNSDIGDVEIHLWPNFGNTATMFGVEVYDQNGALLDPSEYSINSGSGYVYPQYTGVPEPTSMSLLIALVPMALKRRRH